MLDEEAKERNLENALMNQVTKFLLELGDGFAFMGRQKNLRLVAWNSALTYYFITQD